jgi:hypothetical protein
MVTNDKPNAVATDAATMILLDFSTYIAIQNQIPFHHNDNE